MNKKVGIIVGVIVVLLLGVFTWGKLNNGNKLESKEGETVTITHRYGETVVPKNPEKVVVLDLGALDVLDKMGVDIVALPKSSLPAYLEKYKDEKYVDLGTLKEFSLEKINELKPDLIIIEGRQESFYDELSEIAPTIGLGTVNNDHFKSLENNISVLGKIFNKEDFASSELDKINKQVEEINNKVKSEEATALVLMVSDGSMSAFGAGSRFGVVFNEFGFTSADSELGTTNSHGETISYEYILSKNPQYLFIVDKGAIAKGDQPAAKDVVETEIVKKTDAYKNGNIIYLNPQAWYVGGAGVSATNTMIEDMNSAIK